MSNSFVTKQDVAEEILIDFQNIGVIANTSWRKYENRIIGNTWDLGGKLDIPLPMKYIVNDGASISSVPDIEEKKIQIIVNYRKNIPMKFTTQEMTTDSKFNFKERFITPAVEQLSAIVESTLANEMFKHTYMLSGTAGVAPSAYADIARVRSQMNKMMIRRDQRYLGFSEDSYEQIISAGTLQNSFDQKLTRDINRDAQLGRMAQFQSYSTPLMVSHIAGIGDVTAAPTAGFVACGTVKTTVTSGSSIVLTGLGTETGVLNPGDKIVFEGVYFAEPILGTTTNIPFSVSVQDTVPLDSVSGDVTVSISPEIISSATSPYRNISDTAGLQAGTVAKLVSANTGVGSTGKVPYEMNFGYVPEAVIFAAPPLEMPSGIPNKDMARVTDPETQTSIRLYAFTDGSEDLSTHRLDILMAIYINGDRIFGLLG